MRIVTDQTEFLVTKLICAGTSRRNRRSGKPARLPPQPLPRLTQMVKRPDTGKSAVKICHQTEPPLPYPRMLRPVIHPLSGRTRLVLSAPPPVLFYAPAPTLTCYRIRCHPLPTRSAPSPTRLRRSDPPARRVFPPRQRFVMSAPNSARRLRRRRRRRCRPSYDYQRVPRPTTSSAGRAMGIRSLIQASCSRLMWAGKWVRITLRTYSPARSATLVAP